MKPYRLAALTNSLRPGSYNRMALALVEELLPPGAALQWLDLQPLPFYDAELEQAEGIPASVVQLGRALQQVDGLVIASPEYNHSIPARLKNALDWLSRMPQRPLAKLPVMLLSASVGMLGGARVQYDLRRVLDTVGAPVLVQPEVFIGLAPQKFDAQGRCTDAATRQMVAAQLQAFEHWVALWRGPRSEAGATRTVAT